MQCALTVNQIVSKHRQRKVIELDRETALIAADLSLELKLPMADSVILATARAHNAALWMQDEHFKDMVDPKIMLAEATEI